MALPVHAWAGAHAFWRQCRRRTLGQSIFDVACKRTFYLPCSAKRNKIYNSLNDWSRCLLFASISAHPYFSWNDGIVEPLFDLALLLDPDHRNGEALLFRHPAGEPGNSNKADLFTIPGSADYLCYCTAQTNSRIETNWNCRSASSPNWDPACSIDTCNWKANHLHDWSIYVQKLFSGRCSPSGGRTPVAGKHESN